MGLHTITWLWVLQKKLKCDLADRQLRWPALTHQIQQRPATPTLFWPHNTHSHTHWGGSTHTHTHTQSQSTYPVWSQCAPQPAPRTAPKHRGETRVRWTTSMLDKVLLTFRHRVQSHSRRAALCLFVWVIGLEKSCLFSGLDVSLLE